MRHVTIASRIRKARTQRGLSRATLAGLLNVTPTAVWLWEEKEMMPRPRVFTAIAAALGVSEEYLKSGKNSKRTTPTPRSVASIVRNARIQIAVVAGVPVSRVKLNVDFLTDPVRK